MSDENRVVTIALKTGPGGRLLLQVDAEYETDPVKRREIETEVGLAAMELLEAVGDGMDVPLTLESMKWVPERLPFFDREDS